MLDIRVAQAAAFLPLQVLHPVAMLCRAVHIAVLGFAAAATAEGCAADNCLRAVRATARISWGLADCSSFLGVSTFADSMGWRVETGLADNKFFIEEGTGRLYAPLQGSSGIRRYAYFRDIQDNGVRVAEMWYLGTEDRIRELGKPYLHCDLLKRPPQDEAEGAAAPRLWCTHPARGTHVWFYIHTTNVWWALMKANFFNMGDVTVQF